MNRIRCLMVLFGIVLSTTAASDEFEDGGGLAHRDPQREDDQHGESADWRLVADAASRGEAGLHAAR